MYNSYIISIIKDGLKSNTLLRSLRMLCGCRKLQEYVWWVCPLLLMSQELHSPLICISGGRLRLAVFLCGWTADCCRTLNTRSFINAMIKSITFISQCQLILFLQFMKKNWPWEYDYTMTHKVVLWSYMQFYIRTNKSVPCRTMSAVSPAVFREVVIVKVGNTGEEISWYAIKANVTVNANISVNAQLMFVAYMMGYVFSSAEILILVSFKLSSPPRCMGNSDR